MKRLLVFAFLLFIGLHSFANHKDSVLYYQLPDSVKAVQFMAEINVKSFSASKIFNAGIRTDVVSLSMIANGKKKRFYFRGPDYSEIMVTGIGVKASRKFGFDFYHNWAPNLKYKLMVSVASDSAANFSLYSGYVWLPEVAKWKLIGTIKITGRWTTIQQPALFYRAQKKAHASINATQAWCQRQNGAWKNMLQENFAPPVVNLLSHIDSLQQASIEREQLKILQSTSLVVDRYYGESNGVYYSMLKEGTGKQVSVNDTVTVFYKGYIYDDPKTVFDETKDKPATFPLKRLITGWQIGVPLCKVGGKIKIIIPSNLAYSIRTRAAKIPPNSILVFEVEVVDAKSSQ